LKGNLLKGLLPQQNLGKKMVKQLKEEPTSQRIKSSVNEKLKRNTGDG